MKFLPLLAAMVFAVLLSSLSMTGHAQQLPQDPRLSASLAGTVLDANGAALAGAHVKLNSSDGGVNRNSLTGDDGKFTFSELPAGEFSVTVSSAAMETFTHAGIALVNGQTLELPPAVLAIAGITTEVRVSVTQTELAQEQVKAAEQQRVLGVLPNFYSSYLWNAEPLNTRQKFDLALHSSLDPVEFLGVAAVAGAEHLNNTYAGYGKGAQGYAKRYGAAYTDDLLGRMIGSAILPSLLHQDPRYFYRGSGTVRSRTLYALSRSVITRGDNGSLQPNYSRVLGNFAAGGLSNLYHPSGDRGVGLTVGNALIETAGSAVDNLIREFVLRKLTTSVPPHEQGKP